MGLPSRVRELGGLIKQKKKRIFFHNFPGIFREKKHWKNPCSTFNKCRDFFQAYQSEEGQSHRTLMEMLGPPTWSVAEVWSFLFPWIFLGFEEDWGEAKFEAIAAASVWIWPGWKTFPSVTRLLRVVQESQAQETIEENRPQRQDQETQDWWNLVFANCWKWILEQQNFALFPEVTKASERFCCQSRLTAGETSWQVRNGSKTAKQVTVGRLDVFRTFSYCGIWIYLVGWHLWLEQPHGRATRMFKKIGDLLGAASRCSHLTSSFATFAVLGKHDFCQTCWIGAFLTWIKSSLISRTQFHQVSSSFTLWSLEFLLYKL